MILTITLNPAIDKTIEINGFGIGRLNKVENVILDPGGKGINVSKVIESLGGTSIASGFLGGSSGEYIENTLRNSGIKSEFVRIQGETRTNLKVFDAQNKETTEINEPGPNVSREEIERLLKKIESMIEPPCMVVLSGSAPKSVPNEVYEHIVHIAKAKGAVVFVDASGAAFECALKAKPQFIKPNKHELEIYFNKSFETDEALAAACTHFIDQGIENVIISLGKEGAFYANAHQTVRLHPLKVEAHSSVGAGDAFVGACAYAYEKQYDTDEMLRLAVATSAGAVMTIGTKPMDVEWITHQLDRVVIEPHEKK